MAQIDDIKSMLAFLQANEDLKHLGRGRKNWLEKTVGINGANQRKGAIQILTYLLECWNSEEAKE